MFKTVFAVLGDSIRSTGKALDRLGCSIQGNYAYIEKLNRHSRVMPFRGNIAHLGREAFIAPNSSVIGSVRIGHQSSVWYNTVLRGDTNAIIIGTNSIISDRTVINATRDKQTTIGTNVYVGPGAILNGCSIDSNVVIGTGSIVLEGVRIESGASLEAGSIVPANTVVPQNQVWGGSPARFIRPATQEDVANRELLLDDHSTLAQEHEVQNLKSAKELHTDTLDVYANRRERPENVIHNAPAH
ncbi:hypothetical protein SAMD00019534_098660 [Acytostelium subglobosum LB1]|uniref:hypothetical protein n=1 Tax=Acytostelium subglobosum LB1 TaxID=1410327 RepID=UPI000644C5C3|nr:hypothetical protein SAMD00019534_098660 [Acytostelium subglobosum LB1]GAM26691.1 hypothetical protein SAMD00019534_098660 [Acytostelium subglobosum LB1]|eukprot:XP_012750352.1 hypothetical protein SAMD00019534_098660 [Acytostelium subglobosum LB1]